MQSERLVIWHYDLCRSVVLHRCRVVAVVDCLIFSVIITVTVIVIFQVFCHFSYSYS